MPLRKFSVQNYRCFRDRQEIELAPVTVVLGKNNSGKSVLTRAPLVIATGFDTDAPAPLDLDRLGPDAADDFSELFHNHHTLRPIEIGIEVDGPVDLQLNALIEYQHAQRRALVSRLELTAPRVSARLVAAHTIAPARDYSRDIDGIPERPAVQLRHGEPVRYEVSGAGHDPVTRAVPFHGLLPAPVDVPALAGLADLELSLGPIRYLSPYRRRVARQHRLPISGRRHLDGRGDGLAGILADDVARAGGKLVDLVNEKLAAIVPDWRIDEIPAGPLWSTVLTRRGSTVQVNLADAGTGLAQVLPILVQCAMDELHGTGGNPPLQIIEEPEMHLHPAAHAELADLYLTTAKATGTRFLIETHSETLLLRLRRRIAEDRYPADMVQVYVVEQQDGMSNVRRVDIDPLGNLDEDWPEGYFSQDYNEVRALVAAQLDRTEDAP